MDVFSKTSIIIGRTLEAPIPKISGLVRKNDLFSKAFIVIILFLRGQAQAVAVLPDDLQHKYIIRNWHNIVIRIYIYIYIYMYICMYIMLNTN